MGATYTVDQDHVVQHDGRQQQLLEITEKIKLDQQFVDTDVEPADWDGRYNPRWYVFAGDGLLQVPVVRGTDRHLVSIRWTGKGLPQQLDLLHADKRWFVAVSGGKTDPEMVPLPSEVTPLASALR